MSHPFIRCLIERVADIDDISLARCLIAYAGDEREIQADFIVHLAEFDRRRLYLNEGYSSLFMWLTEALRYPNGSAARRMTAARLQARMPVIEAYLRDGRISLTKVYYLRDLLEPATHVALLDEASALTEDKVKELALLRDPKRRDAPPRDSIKPIAIPQPQPHPQPQLPIAAPPPPPPPTLEAPAPPPLPPPPTAAEPPAVLRHVIKMTVAPEFLALLHQVGDALSHSHPGASLETLLGECMRVTLAAHARRVRAETDRPRKTRVPRPRSRRISAADTRAVWKRDEGRCAFVSVDGHRCDATRNLQIDHITPYARDGAGGIDNIRLACAAHNDLLAREAFGHAHMNQFTRRTPEDLPDSRQ